MHVLNPLETTRSLEQSYRRYLRSTFLPRDPKLAREFASALDSHELAKGPFLEASAPFEPGVSVRDLVDEGVLSPMFLRFTDDVFPVDRTLHQHQERAIRKAIEHGRNLIVSTGTGSGKTETFLIPLLNKLFREVEQGTAQEPGVRALLLYPMNALANDQVKRLRRMLVEFPEVTFGRYVGETEHTATKAEESFRQRYPSEPRVDNELLSREEMQIKPPHILLTNYAMLEYLLLRPADSTLFDGATGKFWNTVVLDEAHVYDGAQGTEVAMLLRRVRDRVLESQKGALQCFATSATLGSGADDYPKLVDFATKLFDENFEWNPDDEQSQDIVVAARKQLWEGAGEHSLPQQAFQPIRDLFRADGTTADLIELIGKFGVTAQVEADSAPASALAQVLRLDTTVVAVQQALESRGAVELKQLAAELFEGESADADLVALVDICVGARLRDDDSPLIPARYHYWVGSLEGAYLCVHADHPDGAARLQLHPHKQCPGCKDDGRISHLIEIGVCRSCGSSYGVGKKDSTTVRNKLEQISDRQTPGVYLLLNELGYFEGEEVDEDAEPLDIKRVTPVGYNPGLGTIENPGGLFNVQMHRVAKPTGKTHEPLHSCIVCNSTRTGEVVFRFITGVDAPVSVLASDLYQALPPSADPDQQLETGEGRKLLAFADSRQDAAFFAPYLNRTYNRSVARKLIFDALTDLSSSGDIPRTDDVIRKVRQLAERHLLLDPDKGSITNTKVAAQWVALEMLATDRRQSLDGLGLAEISIAFPRRFQPPKVLTDLQFSEEECRDLLALLLDTLRTTAIVTMPEGVDITDEIFEPRNRQVMIAELSNTQRLKGWVPGGSSNNRRLDLLRKVFARRGIDADPRQVLQTLWRDELTNPSGVWPEVLTTGSDRRLGVFWRINHERLQFLPASQEHWPFRCDSCRTVYWRSVDAACPSYRCEGTLSAADEADIEANHYARLYQEIEPIGLEAQEHTAQWISSEASAIQDDFTSGKLNVLSCSTTFELGVDVGEVQAVLLRNVPPLAANYVQRAGRAGRRQDSAALVVTFAQRRSHDRAYFDDPSPMINGTIAPPMILLDNEPILRRHAHSVAFAAFERDCVDEGGAGHAKVEEFFSGDSPGSDAMVDWLRARPASVGDALDRILPAEIAEALGTSDWSWVEALVEEQTDEPGFGWLGRAKAEVSDQLDRLEEMAAEEYANQRGWLGDRFGRLRNTLASRQLLGFLASRNVLPKYGFPVDVVELDLSGTGDLMAAKLELNRDLKLAISTYSPGSRVVAGRKVWRSAGLALRSDREIPTYEWRVCDDCGAFRSRLTSVSDTCLECGSAMGRGGAYLHPIFGFVGREDGEPGDSRPKSQSISNTYFGSYRSTPPEFELVKELSNSREVSSRTSRQGDITVVNRGPGGQGFEFCSWCGHGQPATFGPPTGRTRPHKDIRRPGRDCEGHLKRQQLGHSYLTDVAEIRIGLATRRHFTDAAMRSTLYALLAAAPKLDVAQRDIDGTLHFHSATVPAAIVLFDNVPGGAGHARLLESRLTDLFREALVVVKNCTCDLTSSCYGCLQAFSNQAYHDVLSRGDAVAILEDILGEGGPEFDEFSPLLQDLLGEIAASDVPIPVPGFELDDEDVSGWIVEAAWPKERIAVLIDSDSDREEWLVEEGWDARHFHDWSAAAIAEARDERTTSD